MTKRLLLLAILCFGQIICDDLLFFIELAKPGYHYPHEDTIDWAKGKNDHLTNAGMRQQYLLGRELRKKLIEQTQFLHDRYIDRQQIMIRTIEAPQAVSSAYAQLMGLYIPGSGDLLNTPEKEFAYPPNKFDYTPWTSELESAALNYTYQAVPIIEHGGAPDIFLNVENSCEGVKSMIHRALTEDISQQRVYKNLYTKLESAFGLPADSVLNVSYATGLRYALLVSIAQGKPQVENDDAKTRDLYVETQDIETTHEYYYTLDVGYGDRNVSKMIASPILRQILNHFEDAKNDNLNKTMNNKLKYIMYLSSSRLIQAVLQQLLWNYDKKILPTSSLIMFELYKNSSSDNGTDIDYYIKLTYNTEEKEPISYPDFVALINANTYKTETFHEYCASYSYGDESKFDWMLLLYIGGGIIALGGIGVLIFFLKSKCKGGESTEEEEEAVLKTLKGQLGVKE